MKLHKADVQLFVETMEVTVLSVNATAYDKVAGSSGGPIVDRMGRLVGVNIIARRVIIISPPPIQW